MGSEVEQVIAYLDTQIVVWIVGLKHQLLTREARRVINGSALLVSPMAALELQYLHEIGRLRLGAKDILEKLRVEIGLGVCDRSCSEVAFVAMGETWTRDPFDRMIVAQAKANGVSPLVTSDEEIRANYVNAIW